MPDVELPAPPDYSHTTDIEVRFRDTDALGHVNNAVYLTYFEVGRQAYWQAAVPDSNYDRVPFVLGRADVSFRSPAYTGERLRVFHRAEWMGRGSFAMRGEIRAAADGRIVAESVCILVTYDYETRRSMPVPAWLRERLETFEGRALPPRPDAS